MVLIWRYAAIISRLEIAANLVRRVAGDDVVLRKVAILDGIVARARVGAFAAFGLLVTGWLISAVTAGALIAIAGFLIVLAFMVAIAAIVAAIALMVATVAALTAAVTLMVAAVATTTLATVAPTISTAISAAALAATVTTTVSAISTTIAITFGIGGAESEVRQVAVSRKMPRRQDRPESERRPGRGPNQTLFSAQSGHADLLCCGHPPAAN